MSCGAALVHATEIYEQGIVASIVRKHSNHCLPACSLPLSTQQCQYSASTVCDIEVKVQSEVDRPIPGHDEFHLKQHGAPRGPAGTRLDATPIAAERSDNGRTPWLMNSSR